MIPAKRRIRETASSAPSQRKPLSDLTNAASFNTPHPHKPPFTTKKRKATTPVRDSPQPPLARQLFLEKEAHIIILSSDEDEPIHPHIRAMTNVYHLSPSDLNSISVKMTDMRGRCALAVCDMLNFEHDVSNLSCANTTIYSLLCQGHFSQVKRLIHPPAGNDDISWITPPKRRASARSLSLLIPCHDETIAHWFLIAIFTLNTGKKRVLIFDSLGLAAGNGRLPTIRNLLRRCKLISKQDKCTAMNTQPQSERECGPRMLMYMIKIGHHMTQMGNRYTFGTLKTELDHLMVHERCSATITEHSLAHNTRTAIIEIVQHKQMELKST